MFGSKIRNFSYNSKIISLILLFFILTANNWAYGNPDTEKLRQYLVKQEMSRSVDDNSVQKITSSFISSDSIWPGIDYTHTSRTGFPHVQHLDNIISMARAYRKPGSRHYTKKQVLHIYQNRGNCYILQNHCSHTSFSGKTGMPIIFIQTLKRGRRRINFSRTLPIGAIHRKVRENVCQFHHTTEICPIGQS